MAVYYPQAAIVLRVTWEDFGTDDPVLQQTELFNILPKSVTVTINDYKEADKFEASIDYSAFPFDPRCMRAIGVQICMEDVKRLYDQANKNVTITPSPDNTVFTGFADSNRMTFDDSTRTVTIEGRDFTSLFTDQKRIVPTPVPLSNKIDAVIQALIDEQGEATEQIVVENRTGSELPVLSALAPDFNPFSGQKNMKKNQKYWDLMMNILGKVGLIGFIELDRFVITKPQNIYEKKQMKQFIWGKSLKDLEFTRRVGRMKNFNVLVRTLNTSKKPAEIIEAKIPLEAVDPDFIKQHGNTEQAKIELDKDGKKVEPPKPADYYTFFVKDVLDKNTLIGIGENVYDEISRQQIEGSLKTFEMEIPEEKDGLSVQMVKFNTIRNGTAIRIYLDQSELAAINSDSSKAEKIRFLVNRGYPRKLAQSFASSLERINTAFYTQSVTFHLDSDSGFEMDLNFINFIDIDAALKD